MINNHVLIEHSIIMTIKEAMFKAAEGGWKPNHVYAATPFDVNGVSFIVGSILLDPLFWQSLGKAMGWKSFDETDYLEPNNHYLSSRKLDEWEYYWHRLIDHLAEGKNIESYFETL